MSWLPRFLGWRVSTDAFDVRFGQLLCFAGAPMILALASLKLPDLSRTEGEFFLGLLASFAVALLSVILGLVLPLAQQRKTA